MTGHSVPLHILEKKHVAEIRGVTSIRVLHVPSFARVGAAVVVMLVLLLMVCLSVGCIHPVIARSCARMEPTASAVSVSLLTWIVNCVTLKMILVLPKSKFKQNWLQKYRRCNSNI